MNVVRKRIWSGPRGPKTCSTWSTCPNYYTPITDWPTNSSWAPRSIHLKTNRRKFPKFWQNLQKNISNFRIFEFSDFQNFQSFKIFEISKFSIFRFFRETFEKFFFENYFSPWWNFILRSDFFCGQVCISSNPRNHLEHS